MSDGDLHEKDDCSAMVGSKVSKQKGPHTFAEFCLCLVMEEEKPQGIPGKAMSLLTRCRGRMSDCT